MSRPNPAEQAGTAAPDMVSSLLQNLGSLFRNEIDLARAEISQNMNRAAVALGLIAGALIVALVSLNVLAAALVAAITQAGVPAGWSAVIVGSVFALIAMAMLTKGVRDLKLSSLAPTRTKQNVRRDAQAFKEIYNDH